MAKSEGGPFDEYLDLYDHALPPPFFGTKSDTGWVGMSGIMTEGGMMEVGQVAVPMIMVLTYDGCGGMA